MNPLQYINKIFCTLLVFCVGAKTHSQREIHPLESMFTYDYALKYYSTQSVKISDYNGYWHIENFKAPKKVYKIIEYEYPDRFIFNYGIYLARSTWLIKKDIEQPTIWKTEHYFDANTNYLQKTILYKVEKKKESVIDTLEIKTYKYTIDRLYTTIKIAKTIFPQQAISDKTFKTTEYYYENSTGSLLSSIRNTDTVSFEYNELNKIIPYKMNSTDSIFKIRKNNNCKTYPHKEITEYLKKIKLEKYPSSLLAYCYEVIGKKNRLISSNYLSFGKDSLYYFSTRLDSEYINIIIFDKDRKLKEFYEFKRKHILPFQEGGFVNEPDMSNPDIAALFNGFEAINLKRYEKKEWKLIFINKIGQDDYEFTTRDKGILSIKKGNIYFMDKPLIIYEFN